MDFKKLFDGKDPEKISALLAQLSGLQGSSETKSHEFWKTQPVIQSPVTNEKGAALEPEKSPHEIAKEPLKLVDGLSWCEVDLGNKENLLELYKLLSENYVEDTESLFRFDYPAGFLEWALKAPGWKKDWHVGIRKEGALVAFVSAIPCTVEINKKYQFLIGRTIDSVEVNFLCIHKNLRSKRMAPILIKEITRRVNLQGIYQALYTAGIVLPTPISNARYYHRSLNPKKLVETGFSQLPQNTSMKHFCKQFTLPSIKIGLRKMIESDVAAVCKLLSDFTSKYTWRIRFSEEEVKHWFLERTGVVYSFVVENEGHIVDFVSFYLLPSSVIGNPKHQSINTAYLFYYAARDEASLKSLVAALLIEARDMGCDVFNCLDVMDNRSFIKELKFGSGDGSLYYYMFNWAVQSIQSSSVAVLML